MDALKKYLDAQASHFKLEGISPESHKVQTAGPVKTVHYLKAGEGPPLLLIHGGGGNVDQWVPLIKLLQTHFTLYIVDRPGCGQTDGFDYKGIDVRTHAVDFIGSFMDAVKLESAYFAGNSMGGMWSILFALKHPQRVKKMVLPGAPAGIYSSKLPFFLKLLGLPLIGSLLFNTIAKPSLKGTRQVYAQILVADVNRLSPEYIETSYLGSLLPGAQDSWRSFLRNIIGFSGLRPAYVIRKDALQLKVPTLMLWGIKDPFDAPAHGREACAGNPDIQIEDLADAGHLPWLDKPETCAKRIKEFLLG